jgi:hypothetical protein
MSTADTCACVYQCGHVLNHTGLLLNLTGLLLCLSPDFRARTHAHTCNIRARTWAPSIPVTNRHALNTLAHARARTLTGTNTPSLSLSLSQTDTQKQTQTHTQTH